MSYAKCLNTEDNLTITTTTDLTEQKGCKERASPCWKPILCVLGILLTICIVVSVVCLLPSQSQVNYQGWHLSADHSKSVYLKGSPIAWTSQCPSKWMSSPVSLKEGLDPVPLRNKSEVPMKTLISDFIKQSEKTFPKDRQHIKDMKAIIGTDEMVHFGQDGRGYDLGFFSAIMECYNNHWALKTIPDDWWSTVVKTVATAIDDHSKNEKVRQFFVNHEGKKELEVIVSYPINYEIFFHNMTNLIQSNINIEGYVDTVSSNFSTSTPTHRIVSEIMVMSSMQEYFEYIMTILCGIPYIEFLGSEDDWAMLKVQLYKLKEMLKPIEKEIKLEGWWDEVAVIFDKILQSVRGDVDIEWWTNILVITQSETFGCGRRKREIETTYDGWFITKLLNKKYGVTSLRALKSGLVSVPLTINNNGLISKAAIVSGIAGMKIDESKDVPVVESTHGWVIFGDEESERVLLSNS